MDKAALIAAISNMGIMAISEDGQRDLVAKIALAPSDLRLRVADLMRSQDGHQMSIQQFLQRMDKVDMRTDGATAIIPVSGVLEYQLTFMGWYLGGTSYRAISNALDAAMGDARIERIVLDVDSPGGTVVGLPETAEKIFAIRESKQKDIVSVANPMSASAALRLSSACRAFYTLGSAWAIGSVGTIAATWSWAKYFEEAGIDYRVISNPDAKSDGHVAKPISDSHVNWLETEIKKHSNNFRAAMAKYRGVSEDEVDTKFGGGRTMTGVDAVKNGLCDAVATLEEVIAMPIIAESKPVKQLASERPGNRGRQAAYSGE